VGAVAAGAAALAAQPALMARAEARRRRADIPVRPIKNAKPKAAQPAVRAVGSVRGPSAAGAGFNPVKSVRRLAGGRMNSLDPRNNPYRLD
jgi:hypothetical protein